MNSLEQKAGAATLMLLNNPKTKFLINTYRIRKTRSRRVFLRLLWFAVNWRLLAEYDNADLENVYSVIAGFYHHFHSLISTNSRHWFDVMILI